MTVVIVDDATIIRAGLKKIMKENLPWIEVIGEAGDGEEGLGLLRTLQPDLCIVDIRMPKLSGIEMVRRARALQCTTKFIVLSGYADFNYAKSMMQYGCEGYLLKPVDHEELIALLASLSEKVRRRSEEPQSGNGYLSKLYSGTHEKMEIHQIPYDLVKIIETTYHLGIFHVDNYFSQGPSEVEGRPYIQRLFEIITEILDRDDKLRGYVSPVNSREVLCILSVPQHDDRSKIIEGFAQAIGTAMRKTNHVTVTVGISARYCGSESLQEAIADAKRVIVNCFYEKWGVVRWSDDTAPSDNLPLLFLIEQQFFHEISLENLVSASEYLEKLMQTMIEHRVPKKQCLLVLNNMFLTLRQMLSLQNQQEILDKIPKNLEFERKTRKCERMEILLREIRAIASTIKSYSTIATETGASENSAIKKALRHIEQDSGSRLSLSEVAKVAQMTPCYFSNLFKQKTGENFNSFVTRIKIEKAKGLLQDTSLKVYEISSLLGFSDYKYFCKKFKKLVNVTPYHYRQAIVAIKKSDRNL